MACANMTEGSHILKTIVMHKILLAHAYKNVGPYSCWDDENLEDCLLECLRAWLYHIDNGLPDIFFPDLNLLERLNKRSDELLRTKQFINRLLYRIHFHSLTWEQVKYIVK